MSRGPIRRCHLQMNLPEAVLTRGHRSHNIRTAERCPHLLPAGPDSPSDIMVISCLVCRCRWAAGGIKIVVVLASSPSALIVWLYFPPRAADCGDTFTKGRPLLCPWDYCVCHQGQYFQMSLFVTLTFKRLIYPPSLWLRIGAAILGRSENGGIRVTLQRLFCVIVLTPRSKWVFNKSCRDETSH